MGLHIELDAGGNLTADQQQGAAEAAQDLAKALTSLGLTNFTGHVHANSIRQPLVPSASVSVTDTPVNVGGVSPNSVGSPPPKTK